MSDIKTSIAEQRKTLSRLLGAALADLALRLSLIWGDRARVNEALRESLESFQYCRALYAMNQQGQQLSGTVTRLETDLGQIGRDRSQRPYMAEAMAGAEFTLSDVYISQNARRPSLTAVQAVRKGGVLLGYVAADFDLRELPLTGKLYDEPDRWRQIKGDPAIRGQLFQQVRVDSLMDQRMDDVLPLVEELMTERGVFHGKLHFSSSRATVWVLDDPYRYRILSFEELVNPDICFAYPATVYHPDAIVPQSDIRRVLETFRKLRFADESIYLRSGSLNVFNGLVGLNFSCDGSHYMPFREFLDKDYRFWSGEGLSSCPV